MSSNFVVALGTHTINIKRKQSQIKGDMMDNVKIGDTIEIIKMVGARQKRTVIYF